MFSRAETQRQLLPWLLFWGRGMTVLPLLEFTLRWTPTLRGSRQPRVLLRAAVPLARTREEFHRRLRLGKEPLETLLHPGQLVLLMLWLHRLLNPSCL